MQNSKVNRSVMALTVAISIVATMYLWNAWRNDECPAGNPTTSLSVNGVVLSIEVAADKGSRSCGLSNRAWLPKGQGMLFVYKEERFLEFWMKDTRIPLALAYIGNDRKIRQILHMEPGAERHIYRSHEPAQYALETNPGWFLSNDISVGDSVKFSLPDGLLPCGHRDHQRGAGAPCRE